jgi:hypothetical protein
MCSQRIEQQMILQKKVDILDKKIHDLNAQKKKIETDIAHQLLNVITAHSGLALPFHVLVGGLISIIETSKNNPQQMEEWQVAGEKFLKSRPRASSKSKRSTSSTAKSAQAHDIT